MKFKKAIVAALVRLLPIGWRGVNMVVFPADDNGTKAVSLFVGGTEITADTKGDLKIDHNTPTDDQEALQDDLPANLIDYTFNQEYDGSEPSSAFPDDLSDDL